MHYPNPSIKMQTQPILTKLDSSHRGVVQTFFRIYIHFAILIFSLFSLSSNCYGQGSATVSVTATYIYISYVDTLGPGMQGGAYSINWFSANEPAIADGTGNSGTGGGPIASKIYIQYKRSQYLPSLRQLASLSTNGANVKLAFQSSNQTTVTKKYELSAKFAQIGLSLGNEYGETKTWTLNGEFTTPENAYWVFQAEEDLINDFYDIIEEFDYITSKHEVILEADQIAQKQNRLYYNIYKNGQRL